MTKLGMHDFDAKPTRNLLASYESEAAHSRELLATNCYAAHSLHRRFVAMAHLRWALERDETALAGDLRGAAEAGALVFEAAHEPNGWLTHGLAPSGEVRVRALGDVSFGVAEVWIDAFYAALLIRNRTLLDRLCGPASTLLEGGDGESPRFRLLLAEALKRLWLDGDAAPELLLEAMEATKPETLDEEFIDEALMRAAPAVLLLTLLGERDGGAFETALADYQEEHRQHYSLAVHAKDWRGYLSLDEAALAAVAVDRGMAVGVASDYLPAGLISRGT